MDFTAAQRNRTILPFLAVAVVSLATLALPPYQGSPAPVQTAAAVAAGLGTALLALLTVRLPADHPFVAVPPLMFLLVVGLVEYVGGGESWGLSPLVMLPVLWFVLQGTRTQLLLSGVGAALFFVLPLVLVGPPTYPLSEWRRALAYLLLVLVVCPLLQRAVEQLRESVATQRRTSAQLASVLAAATEHAVVVTDLDGRVTLFSAGAERMLGLAAADVLGRDAGTVGLTDDHAPHDGSTPVGGPRTRETRYRRSDGSTVPVIESVTPLPGADGRQAGWTRVATDISEQEAARHRLQTATDRWRSLVGLLPRVTVAVVGPDLTYRVAVGEEAARRPDPVVGRTLSETATPGTEATLDRLYRGALAGRAGSAELVGGSGNLLHVDVVPLEHPDGPEALVVAHDITEVRAREQSLRRAVERFARLFDEAPHATMIVTPNGRVDRVNPALSRLVGLPADRLVGRNLETLPFDLAGVETALRSMLADDGDPRLAVETQVTVPDQQPADVSLSAAALDLDGTEGRSLLDHGRRVRAHPLRAAAGRPGGQGPADGAGQPAPVRRRAGVAPGPVPPPRGHRGPAHARPGRLQAGQRHPGARHGRPGHQERGRAAAQPAARRRRRGPLRR